MTDYRLYFIDESGHIKRVVELDCATEAEAVREAESHVGFMAMELWQRARVVTKFPAQRRDAA